MKMEFMHLLGWARGSIVYARRNIAMYANSPGEEGQNTYDRLYQLNGLSLMRTTRFEIFS